MNREIIEAMVTLCQEFQGQKPVFDGKKNLYCRRPLPFGKKRVCYSSYSNNRPNEGTRIILE